MLYRVTPIGHVTWNKFSLSLFRDLVEKEKELDLDVLEWMPVDEIHNFTQLVSIALRHGLKTGTGIAFEGRFLSTVQRPALLRATFADLQRSSAHPQIKATDELMESIAPGWIEGGERLDRNIEESAMDSISEAEAEADKVLNAPIDPDLADWWKKLGGFVA